ncbi:hypothetical protein [Chryseobacterium wanjuense]
MKFHLAYEKNTFNHIIDSITFFSQEKEVLKYFKSKDSLIGVKNQNGKIIVPAQFKIFSYLKDGELVKGEIIYFDGDKYDEKPGKNEWGYVYDRKGNFLYRPFFTITEQIISLKG